MSTQTEVENDARNARVDALIARLQDFPRKFRENETYDPEAITETIYEAEAVLRLLLTKPVAGDWVVDGFDVNANMNALSPLPVEAKVYVSHKTLVGKDAMISWGESGSEDAFDFITGLDGYPAGIHLVFEAS